jgi:hypothetical protein
MLVWLGLGIFSWQISFRTGQLDLFGKHAVNAYEPLDATEELLLPAFEWFVFLAFPAHLWMRIHPPFCLRIRVQCSEVLLHHAEFV